MIEHILVCNHDTYISYANLPRDVKGFVVSTADGYNIIVNSNLSFSTTVKVLKHEIEHIIKNHMSSMDSVNQIET